MIKILFCGDIVGKAGRESVKKHLPKLKQDLKLDFVVVNGENSAHGFGITEKIYKELIALGVDVITLGNHIWDQKSIEEVLEKEKNIIRPCNIKECVGFGVFKGIIKGKKIAVINAIGSLFMKDFNSFDSFTYCKKLVQELKKEGFDIIMIDYHAEATSEKNAFAHYLDGEVTAILGTHSHIPTLDLRILEKGTLYKTDVGMCGDYDSVIGMKKEIAIERFLNKDNKPRLSPAEKNSTLAGVYFAIDEKTCKIVEAQNIIMEPFM